MVATRIQYLEYAIRDVVLPAMELERQGHEILKLNIGDPIAYDFDTPDHIKEALYRAVKEGHNGYANSQGDAPVREAVARREKRIHGTDIDPDKVIITAGLSEAIMFIYGALVENVRHILAPVPSYPLYISFGRVYGEKSTVYYCNEEKDWQPDLDDLQKRINEKTQAIVVINPNNPTGAVYPKKTLKEIVNLAGQHNIPIIADEIYDQLVYTDFTSFGEICGEVPCVVMNGLSKNHLAPGWRGGYMCFLNADELMEACNKQARNRLCAPTPIQYAMAAALDGPDDHIEETKKKLLPRRNLMYKRLNEIEGISCVEPKGAFYAFPKLENVKDDKRWVLELLKEKHVLTVFGSGFGSPGHFRLVYLPPLEVIDEAMDRIEEFMKKYEN
ncbi:MAG: aminotransferase class I/II-fold pyridoxal phosphate-dependent enzyme [Candidatus Diapherotrites archaeon]|nr:aminotransferase class I/II-fold pyridoxal phosphate-dependent enzyme [Candidatus Diapherotrites archaeon]